MKLNHKNWNENKAVSVENNDVRIRITATIHGLCLQIKEGEINPLQEVEIKSKRLNPSSNGNLIQSAKKEVNKLTGYDKDYPIGETRFKGDKC